MLAKKLSEYAFKLKYSDLSKKTIHKVKLHFLDALGAAIASKDAPPVAIIHPEAEPASIPTPISL